VAIADGERAKERAAQAIERTARAKAMKAFVEAGGALAYFQRWWPESFAQVAEDVIDPQLRDTHRREGRTTPTLTLPLKGRG
jgi:hypothetical protein